ncbi:RNA polymerase sigma factor [Arthrobacter mobilis]|uniref:Sigma-70 family RNA polymerase sigma factor n=1 Tax=Arthrobacter mobilis TaxID=2724944 RepID=A0A7X6K6K5_9MICC|nr:sigma-70 family RNA polymerase sigma factor [Arthrobacter mobilis]NKX55148.1 sigma-70 family RNA polymerase sigma factor [Arthrobacter mobilis]
MKPFEQLVADHGAAVLRICRVVLGPGPDAEDAWSETFLAALKAYPGLPAGANHEAWLVTIARRKAIDIVRARARSPVPVAILPEAASTHGNPGDDGGLWHAVGLLPLRQREAIAYHYLAGLPYQEAAELTGSTPAAVRRAAADGVAKLRLAYRPEFPNESPAAQGAVP